MLTNPFDKLAERIRKELRQAILEELRKYKATESEKCCDLSWEEAWNQWTEAHRQNLGQYLSKFRADRPRSGAPQPAVGSPRFREADSLTEAWAPQEERTTSLQASRMSREGMSGAAIRSNIAATAASPISRHG